VQTAVMVDSVVAKESPGVFRRVFARGLYIDGLCCDLPPDPEVTTHRVSCRPSPAASTYIAWKIQPRGGAPDDTAPGKILRLHGGDNDTGAPE
jgi:hypothetical protein